MKKENLVEFLSSIIEEDAIISRLYNLFHIKYGYEIQELDGLVQYGISNSNFIIEQSDFIKLLFSENPEIPKDFVQFLD